MPNSSAIATLVALTLWVGAAMLPGVALAGDRPDRPMRVVSANLCTDQLAMLLAGPGQLLSVSFIASDPRSSAMTEQAARYPANYGRAEEIFLMKPDLVLMGRYSNSATRQMLERIGVPVVIFDLASSMEDVRARMLQMGEVLGQSARAADAVADFDARLAGFQSVASKNPRAALYYANGYTAGDRTLAGQILTSAGLANVAAELGYSGGGVIPLEVLALAQPDTVVTGRPYPGGSRAENIMQHPVVEMMRKTRPSASLTDHDWVCGTPYVLRAVESMVHLRHEMQGTLP